MRKKNGFTLVELLSTVVILGVVLSVTVYIVMKNINKAKDNAKLITYNNIKDISKIYTDEVASYWNIKDDYEYSCISLGDMIEIGYFDENTINENDKLTKETKIKVIRDKDSKVIKETSFSFEDSILPDVDCGYQSSISISTDNKGKKVKTTNAKILYNGLNDSYYRYFYISGFDENTITTNDIVYSCEGIGNCSNNIVNNLESGHWYLTNSDLVRLSIKSNGTISAFINYNGENVAEAIKNIDFVDNTPPVISLGIYKIGSYEGNTPSTKGDLITNTSSDYIDSEWKNYGYWFDISTDEDTVIKWTYNNTNNVNGDSPSNSGANCNTSCSKTLSGDGNRKATIIATDEAGNSSKIEVNVYIDRTPPVLTWGSNGPGEYKNNNGITVNGTCSDAMSGVAQSSLGPVAISSPTNGKDVTISCTDLAGNLQTLSGTFYVKYYSEHESCGVKSYKSCPDASCGYKTCSNSACGVKLYNYCQNASCGYNSCANEKCGVKKYKSCKNSSCGYASCRASGCGVNYYVWHCCNLDGGKCHNYYQKENPFPNGNCGKTGTVYNECNNWACGYKTCRTSNCGVESYNSCATAGCGAKSCRTSNCGVESYNECENSACGTKTCRAEACGIESYNECWHY